eukprot:4263076-Lingulodinium_polyedra.AAC.1
MREACRRHAARYSGLSPLAKARYEQLAEEYKKQKEQGMAEEREELSTMLNLARERLCRSLSEDKNPPMVLSACQLNEGEWAEWDRLYRLSEFKGVELQRKVEAAMIAPPMPKPGDPFIADLKKMPVPEAEEEATRPA